MISDGELEAEVRNAGRAAKGFDNPNRLCNYYSNLIQAM
jgi:hypothetical protein